jgi:hypothetical protein
MTPSELRELAEAATPGPWGYRVNEGAETWGWILGFAPGREQAVAAIGLGTNIEEPNARLIALAPDLARLCAEMAEALDASDSLIRFLKPDLSHTRPRANEVAAHNRSALAKLAELEAQ